MSKELDEKWWELVATGRAEWMPRMVDQTGRIFIEHVDCGEAAWLWVADDGCEWLPVLGRLPDWSDPATLGALLGQVREAWGDSKISVHYDGEGEVSCRLGFEARSPPAKWVVSLAWGVDDWSGCVTKGHSTEAEALLAALEAAP